MKKILLFYTTFLGTGFSPIAPGTISSLFALPLLWHLSSFTFWGFPILWFLSIFFTLISIPAINIVCQNYFKSKDPSAVTIDEFTGMIFSVLLLNRTEDSFWMFILAFLLFRIFDITKPSVINHSQNLPGAWGVMADDLLAGMFTAFILFVIKYTLSF